MCILRTVFVFRFQWDRGYLLKKLWGKLIKTVKRKEQITNNLKAKTATTEETTTLWGMITTGTTLQELEYDIGSKIFLLSDENWGGLLRAVFETVLSASFLSFFMETVTRR